MDVREWRARIWNEALQSQGVDDLPLARVSSESLVGSMHDNKLECILTTELVISLLFDVNKHVKSR